MSAYVGIAEQAFEIALKHARKKARQQNSIQTLIGKLYNTLFSAQTQWKAMYALTNNFDFQPSEAITMQILSLKTNVAEATRQVVADAIEIVGGQSYYQKNTLERLFRDIQAAQFHPLPKWSQYDFCENILLENIQN